MIVTARTSAKPLRTITIIFGLGLIITLSLGCSRRAKFEGVLIGSYEEASSVVGTYREEDLSETQFLLDWPMIGREVGKDEFAWGIVKTSTLKTGGKVKNSYWLGYLKSKGTTGTRANWTGHGVWRFDFEDSVLVSRKKWAIHKEMVTPGGN